MELKIEHLSKIYSTGVRALDDLTVTLTPGIHGILGPNGAGKSTLMQILTCNLSPSSGDILWNGNSILADRRDYCASLGYMPQQQAMYPSFTPVQYLSYMAELRNMPKRTVPDAIRDVLDRVGLLDVANRKISTFSGGMKQRLLLAQAVLSRPKILILDEPTAGLDPYQRIAIRNIISELSTNCIVLLATHVVSDVEVIARDILLLNKGELLHFDRPGALCASIQGRVHEVVLPDQRIPEGWIISSVRQQMDGRLAVRVLADTPPQGFASRPVEPTLEDLFLHEVGAIQ